MKLSRLFAWFANMTFAASFFVDDYASIILVPLALGCALAAITLITYND